MHKFIYIAIALAFTTVLGALLFQRMANAKLALKVAEQQAVAIDLEQEAEEDRLGRLDAEEVAEEAQAAAYAARPALQHSRGKRGKEIDIPKTDIVPVKERDIVPANGVWTITYAKSYDHAALNNAP